MVLGRLVHYGFDAIAISTILAGIKKSTGYGLVVYSTDVDGWQQRHQQQSRSGSGSAEEASNDVAASSRDDTSLSPTNEVLDDDGRSAVDPDDEEEASQLLYYYQRRQDATTSADGSRSSKGRAGAASSSADLNGALRLTGLVKGVMGLTDMFRTDDNDAENVAAGACGARFHVIRTSDRKTFAFNPEGTVWLVTELLVIDARPARTSVHGSGKRLTRLTKEDEWAKVPETYIQELLEVAWKRCKMLHGPLEEMSVAAAKQVLSQFWSDWLSDVSEWEDVKLQDWLRLSRVDDVQDLVSGAAQAIAQLAEYVDALMGDLVILRGDQTIHCGHQLRDQPGLLSYLRQESRRARKRSLQVVTAAAAPDAKYGSLGVRPQASTSDRSASGSRWFPSVKIDYTLGLAGLFKVDTGDDLGIGTRRVATVDTKRPASVPPLSTSASAKAEADNVSVSDLADALQDGAPTSTSRKIWMPDRNQGVVLDGKPIVLGNWFCLEFRMVGECLFASVLPTDSTRPAELIPIEDTMARLLAKQPIEVDLAHAVAHQTPSVAIDDTSRSVKVNQSWRHTIRRQKDEDLMLNLRDALLSHGWQENLTRTMEDQWIGVRADMLIKSAKGDMSLTDMDRAIHHEEKTS